jgi:hypothetical protein
VSFEALRRRTTGDRSRGERPASDTRASRSVECGTRARVRSRRDPTTAGSRRRGSVPGEGIRIDPRRRSSAPAPRRNPRRKPAPRRRAPGAHASPRAALDRLCIAPCRASDGCRAGGSPSPNFGASPRLLRADFPPRSVAAREDACVPGAARRRRVRSRRGPTPVRRRPDARGLAEARFGAGCGDPDRPAEAKFRARAVRKPATEAGSVPKGAGSAREPACRTRPTLHRAVSSVRRPSRGRNSVAEL